MKPRDDSPSLGDPRITLLLRELEEGSDSAVGRLLPLVYDELHSMAGRLFRRQPTGHTLQPTVLVHDAYLRLVGSGGEWNDRFHFFVVATKAMRQILADHARGKGADKRGGAWQRVTLDDSREGCLSVDADLSALHHALEKLAKLNERQSQIVELRFLGGLSIDEVAEIVGVSVATVGNDWRMARAWLRRELDQGAAS